MRDLWEQQTGECIQIDPESTLPAHDEDKETTKKWR